MRPVIGAGGGGTAVAAGIVADEIAVDQVVRMDPLPRLDRLGRLADDLAVLADVVALADRPHGDLVPEPHRLRSS